MITKNKETIEKLQKGCKQYAGGLGCSQCKEGQLYDDCETRLEATIKTSIEWCEDEIERIRRLRYVFISFLGEEILGLSSKIYKVSDKELQELTSHLKWLKEQEKRL